MTNRQIVNELMDHIHRYCKELDDVRYSEVLESLWFEIEDERSRLADELPEMEEYWKTDC